MEWQPLLITASFITAYLFLLVGVTGLVRRSPVVIHREALAGWMLAAALILIGACSYMAFERAATTPAFAGLALVAIACSVGLRQMYLPPGGCLVVGTNSEWVRVAVRASLYRMSIPFVDRGKNVIDVRLTTGANAISLPGTQKFASPLQVVRMGNQRSLPSVVELSSAMRDYFRNNDVETNHATFGYFLAKGLVLTCLGVYLSAQWLNWL